MTDPMREAFEREVLQKRGWKNDYTVADGVFKYTHHQVQQAYEVWQAALSQPRMTEDEAIEIMASAVSRNGWKDYDLAEADAKAMYRALLAKLPAQSNRIEFSISDIHER